MNKFLSLVLCAAACLTGIPADAQWTEHSTPVGFPVSSLAFSGDDVFAAWVNPANPAFGGAVVSKGGGPWAPIELPQDTLCPGGLCKPKYLDSENGHLYYFNPTWPAFLYRSDDGGDNWTEILPDFTEADEFFFSGDRIFYTIANVVWLYDPVAGQWFNSFSSSTNSDIGGLCKWGDQLLLADGAGVYVSNNNGDSWALLSDQVRTWPNEHGDVAVFGFGNSAFVSVRDSGLYTSVNGGADWVLKPFPGGDFLVTMTELNGRLLCSDGLRTYQSTDNGLSWQRMRNAPGAVQLKAGGSGLFLAASFGILASGDGETWYTRNDALDRLYDGTWETVENKSLFSFGGSLFLADDFGLFETRDDGETWRYAGQFTDIRQGLPAGDALLIRNDDTELKYAWWISRDTARTWEEVPLPPSQINDGRKKLVYGDGRLFAFVDKSCYRSEDFGMNWLKLPQLFSPGIQYATFAQGKVFAGTYPGTGVGWYVSDNYGETWSNQSFFVSNGYEFFSDGTAIYARDGNHLLRYNGVDFDFVQFFFSIYGKAGVYFWNQVVLLFSHGSSFHRLLGSSDHGETWAELTSSLPLISQLPNDKAGGAAGVHQGGFYAFGQSEETPMKPVLWRLQIEEPERPVHFGKVYFDMDLDKELGYFEAMSKETVVYTHQGRLAAITGADGGFAIYGAVPGDTIRVQKKKPYWHFDPPYIVLTENPQPLLFRVYIDHLTHDLALNATPESGFVPGKTTGITLHISEDLPQDGSGKVVFIKPPSLNLAWFDTNLYQLSGDTIIWCVTSKDNLGGVTRFGLEVPADIPPGTTYDLEFNLTTTAGDYDPADNTATIRAIVENDLTPPLEKTVDFQELEPDQAAQGEWLDYVIHFQRTTGFDVTNYRIRDTLDPSLDLRTFRLTSTNCYECSFFIWPGNVLETKFNVAFLSNVVVDESKSNGFLRYSIRTKPGLTLGDTIRNQATFSVPFQPLFQTNVAKTWVKHTASATNSGSPLYLDWEISPNPANDELNIRRIGGGAPSAGRLLFLDLSGRPISQKTFATRVSTADLPPGLYFILLQDGPDKVMIGKVIIHR
ncbi:MAG: hypothetical protein H6562_13735 [Lewinellaceae bacterium]|nr:hypothetical protein [Lewinellaceae bacterium]